MGTATGGLEWKLLDVTMPTKSIYVYAYSLIQCIFLSYQTFLVKLSTNNANFDILGLNYHANAILCKYFL